MAKTADANETLARQRVLVVAGTELYLRNEMLAQIQLAVLGPGDPGMGLVRYDHNAKLVDVLDECRMPSMFAPRKMVVVNPADDIFKASEEGDTLGPREVLENYLASPSEFGTLVLVCNNWMKTTRIHKKLDAQGAIMWALPVKFGGLTAWITRRSREAYQKSIAPDAAARLAELVGADLQRLDNELAKLALYRLAEPTIERPAVDALVGFQHEQTIFELMDALGRGDARAVLTKLDEVWLMDRDLEHTVAGALFYWLMQVIKASDLIGQGQSEFAVVKALRIWPESRGEQICRLARHWGVAGCARWSRSLMEVDLANKSGLGELRGNIERFLVELCTSIRTMPAVARR